jgi:uncharacterized protein (DUF488 family)
MPADSHVTSAQGRRELRQLRRRQKSQSGFLVLLVIGAVALAFLAEVGRAYYQMQRLKAFVTELSQQTPWQVKNGLDEYAALLADHNPLVRQAAVAAFMATTRRSDISSPIEWRVWWRTHRDAWQYDPNSATNAPEYIVSPQPYRQAFPGR